jgi:hypothetical protein
MSGCPFLNLLGNIFASQEPKNVSAKCFLGCANWETLTGSKVSPGLKSILQVYQSNEVGINSKIADQKQ